MTASRPAPIVVDLGDRSYAIHVGRGILDEIGGRVAAVAAPGAGVALVTNPTVDALFGERVRASLRAAGRDVVTISIPDGEEHKNLAWLAFVYEKLIAARIERGGALVALGGGVVGDLTGFAAATYLRGVSFVQVPTTLVAQIDASIGGKTAVNLAAGKNLIGAFHQPSLVLADVATLESLPQREYLAGIAEVVKTAAILSPDLFARLEGEAAGVLAREPRRLEEIVHACARLKALVVAADETEGDYRAILNFGHTLGHAVEALSGYTGILHGEAVAIGMAFAVAVSESRGLLPAAVARRVLGLLSAFGLPTGIPPGMAPAALALAVESDKKRSGGRVKFVCLEDLGRTRFEMLSTREVEDLVSAVARGARE